MAEMMTNGLVCECCMMVCANGDESSCRDYYEHTHQTCSNRVQVVDVDTVITVGHIGFDCDGCGTFQQSMANMYPAVLAE